MPKDPKDKMGKVPDGYFEHFYDKLKSKIDHIEDDTKDIAPILSSIGKREGFLLPGGYMENLKAKAGQGARAKRRVLPFYYKVGIAASFAALMAAIFFLPLNTKEQTLSFAELEDEVLLDYLNQHVNDFEDFEIFDLNTNLIVDKNDQTESYQFLLDNINEYELDELIEL